MKEVIISDAVYRRISKYIRLILTTKNPKYRVSYKTALTKWHNLIYSLKKNLSNPMRSYPLTHYIQLGKKNGYKQYKYQDPKSKTSWYFGFKESDNGIIVYVMKNSSYVTEELNNEVIEVNYQELPELSEFRSWMKRLDEVKGARPTFWC